MPSCLPSYDTELLKGRTTFFLFLLCLPCGLTQNSVHFENVLPMTASFQTKLKSSSLTLCISFLWPQWQITTNLVINWNVFLLSCEGQKSEINITGINPRGQSTGPSSLWRLQGRMRSLPLPASGGRQQSLAYGHIIQSWLLWSPYLLLFCVKSPSASLL